MHFLLLESISQDVIFYQPFEAKFFETGDDEVFSLTEVIHVVSQFSYFRWKLS